MSASLRKAYIFLRNLEHAIHRQTQTFPDDLDGCERIAAVRTMAVGLLLADLQRERAVVSEQFSRVIVDRRKSGGTESGAGWTGCQYGGVIAPCGMRIRMLKEHECPDAGALAEALLQLRDSGKVQHLQAQGRARLDQFMPVLVGEMVLQQVAETGQKRLLAFVETVLRRTAYFAAAGKPRSTQNSFVCFQKVAGLPI